MTTQYVSEEERVKEVLRRIESLRSVSLRRFLMLYFYVKAHFLEFTLLEKYGGWRKPRTKRTPGLKFIMEYLGCSRRAAQDYQTALTLISKIDGILH